MNIKNKNIINDLINNLSIDTKKIIKKHLNIHF